MPFAEIPQLLDNVPAGKEDLFKLEAPLAVEASPPRSGFFPINKFSTTPLLAQAARSAREESVQGFPSADGADARKRLMVVPNCHVVRLIPDVAGGKAHVTGVLTSQGFIALPPHGVAVVALGTIECTRVALLSFGGITNYPLIGTNLMAHLRSNMAIRVPRTALKFLKASEKDLEQSALFLKGRHTHPDGSVGHFHLQITASAGGGGLGTNSDAELFQKIPDIDLQRPFRAADLNHVVLTLRSIGETQPENPQSRITLKLDALDERWRAACLRGGRGCAGARKAHRLAADEERPRPLERDGQGGGRGGTIVAYPSGEYAVLVYGPKGFSNFILRLQLRLDAPDDNSGVFVRFRYPFKSWPDLAGNPAVQNNRGRVTEVTGYEAQIDDLARQDGADKHRTGAIYDVEIGAGAGQQQYNRPAPLPPDVWHDYEIEVAGELYKVRLNGQLTSTFTNTDPKRGRPASEDPFFGFLGVQSHTGLTAFRNIRIKET